MDAEGFLQVGGALLFVIGLMSLVVSFQAGPINRVFAWFLVTVGLGMMATAFSQRDPQGFWAMGYSVLTILCAIQTVVCLATRNLIRQAQQL